MAVKQVSSVPVHQQLVDGPDAFYNQPDYVKRTEEEMASKKVLPTAYTWNTESKAMRVARVALSILVFPIGIYRVVYGLVGFAVLPSAAMGLSESLRAQMHRYRQVVPIEPRLSGDWRYKRLTIEVDGYKIDAVMMGKIQTLSNGRWVVSAGGNGEFYEHELKKGRAKDIANETDSNVLLFNYATTMCSTGVLPTRKAMEKSMRAMIHFLEDKEKGVGASEIIQLGHSIGGGVLADVLENHKFSPNVRRVAVLSRTFRDLSTTARLLVAKVAGIALKILGWNQNPARAIKQSSCPRVILQTGRNGAVVGDGIIVEEAALAKPLLADPQFNKDDVMLVKEGHNSQLSPSTISLIGEAVNARLGTQQSTAAAAA